MPNVSHDSVFVADWCAESTIEENSPVIRNVLLCGNMSRNGYEIPPTAFGSEENAKTLYEGKLVFIDHDRKQPLERSTKDLGGIVSNVSLKNGRPYGDIDTEGTPAGAMLLTLAKKRLPGVGMSHVAAYRKARRGNVVESVEAVASVDVVVRPATTNSFYEQTHTGDPMDVEVLQNELASVRAERDGLKEQITKLTVTAEGFKTEKATATSQIETLQTENTKLQADLDAYKAKEALEERRSAVLESLRKADLDINDEVVCSPQFVESLVRESDESVRTSLIEDRKAILGKAKTGASSRERHKPTGEEWDAETFLTKAGSNLFTR